METLQIDGRDFKKASVIAREFGYTSDYVGQLCRGGKITAQLVGRSWYVDVDSLTDHKENRYRSTAEKSKQSVRKVVEQQTVQSDTQHKKPTNYLRFSTNVATPAPVTYTDDEAELFPAVAVKAKKQPMYNKIDVVHADAEKLNIRSTGDTYTITASKKPSVQFSGSLNIMSGESGYDHTTVPEALVAEPTPETPASVATRPKKVSTPAPVSATAKKPTQAVSAKSQIKKQAMTSEVRTVAIMDASQPSVLGGRFVFFVLTNAFALALVVFFASVSLTSTVVVENNAVQIAYAFSIPDLEATLLGGLK